MKLSLGTSPLPGRRMTSFCLVLLLSLLAGSVEYRKAHAGDAKKKLYISTVKTDGVPLKLAAEVREGLKLAIIERYGHEYYVMDDEAVKVMYKQAEKIMIAGCGAESCIQQIADAINADEIIYGDLRGEGGNLTLVLNCLTRDPKSFAISTKSMVKEGFTEKLLPHFVREAAAKLVDPAYTMKKPREEVFKGAISLKGIEVDTQRGVDITVLNFNSTDESVQKILGYTKELMQEGDILFKDGNYKKAAKQYVSILDRIRSKLTEESQKKMAEFTEGAKRRADASYAMLYKAEIEEVDSALQSEMKADESFLENILEEYGKVRQRIIADIPAYARGDAISGILKTIEGREDAACKAMVVLFEKQGDVHYHEYRFADALESYQKGRSYGNRVRDEAAKLEITAKLSEKTRTVNGTGRSFVQNRIKTLADLAEFYNFKDETSEAKGALKEARKLITGTFQVFATREAVAAFNTISRVIGTDEITRDDMPEAWDTNIAEKRLSRQLQAEKTSSGIRTINPLNIKVKTIGDIEFVFIPGGIYIMGGANLNEKPQHRVAVKDFWMSKFELTQKQYRSTIGVDPCNNSNYGIGDDYPVHFINWSDAKSFCDIWSAKYNMVVRLPSEAEWEYACNAGGQNTYFWGNEMDGEYCWYSGNSGRQTHPVGTRRSNIWGLYDMNGNVWEWCGDWYGDKYYSDSPEQNPQGPADGKYRILRGGSWGSHDVITRSAYRHWSDPNSKGGDIGFRIVSPGP
ncbi:MAG: formylglycine-generating enzyme family protein [Spirochaetes bacterium]|nr:MAG: formylglycine-generating enzyme family protein [Spirochaetota bacterium]